MREKSPRFAEPLSVEARCASTAAKTFARLDRANVESPSPHATQNSKERATSDKLSARSIFVVVRKRLVAEVFKISAVNRRANVV